MKLILYIFPSAKNYGSLHRKERLLSNIMLLVPGNWLSGRATSFPFTHIKIKQLV